MAVLTGIRRRQMGGVLACCTGAVVAGRAACRHVGVTEVGRNPAAGLMAIRTLGGGGDVRCGLALSLGPIVAARAGAGDIGVIDRAHRRPGAGGVAILADVVGRDVGCGLSSGAGAIVAA